MSITKDNKHSIKSPRILTSGIGILVESLKMFISLIKESKRVNSLQGTWAPHISQ